MRFNPKARIDQSQIETRGGGGGGGGGTRFPIPLGGGGGKIGIGTVVIVILYVVITQFTGSSGGGGDTATKNTCETGADANKSDACAVDLFTNSVQDFWTKTYPEQEKGAYEPITTVRFSGSTTSKCGQAGAEMGPFYCPNDRKVYLDSSFFKDMLEGQLGAKGGTFAIGYVIAHEYGHHIEDQLGILGKIRTQQGAKSDSVRVELMADCLAGVWAKNSNDKYAELDSGDIDEALNAAAQIGDDALQKRSQRYAVPDSFTHGS